MKRKWKVVSSFMINHPEFFEAGSIGELMKQVQVFADETEIGPMLTFRNRSRGPYEMLQAFFINRKGDKTRFMKLEEVDLGKVKLFVSLAVTEDGDEPLIGVGYSADAAELDLENQIAGNPRWSILDPVSKEIQYHAPAS